ncbi:hypothetical protein [Tateyamaria sp.]|uniref:hypothetical protein n=1 Tax=Tateyamaria sp. TaxID=1929288 RepID=UPI0032A0F7C2
MNNSAIFTALMIAGVIPWVLALMKLHDMASVLSIFEDVSVLDILNTPDGFSFVLPYGLVSICLFVGAAMLPSSRSSGQGKGQKPFKIWLFR